jgi:hypothetical protein
VKRIAGAIPSGANMLRPRGSRLAEIEDCTAVPDRE